MIHEKIILEFFPRWSYPEALAWMDYARDRVEADKNLVILGYGSHTTKIITLGRSGSEQELEAYKKNSRHSCLSYRARWWPNRS